jgi:predicted DNA-binding transcriptional regulator YafY
MKLNRLIGILSILLQQQKVTAPFLAEKFEVSRRTINRDVEDLCKAGIPIVTTQGQNGGISIMDGYRMDRTLLTSADMQSILAGLRSLDSISGTNRYQQLMEKLSAGNSSVLTANHHIMINLAMWNKSALAPKIELLQSAIEHRQTIRFDYYSPTGDSHRVIEPYVLVFQWSSWYVWGYCLEKQDLRLFRLTRMAELKATGQSYLPRPVSPPALSTENVFPVAFHVSVRFLPSMKWRLMDEFGADSFKEQEDGTLLFSFGFTNQQNLFSWLLSCGTQAELLEPKELREALFALTKEINQKYCDS